MPNDDNDNPWGGGHNTGNKSPWGNSNGSGGKGPRDDKPTSIPEIDDMVGKGKKGLKFYSGVVDQAVGAVEAKNHPELEKAPTG